MHPWKSIMLQSYWKQLFFTNLSFWFQWVRIQPLELYITTKHLFFFGTELLTHEVEITLSSHGMSYEANHFMKLYSSINNWSKRWDDTHVLIHLCIHQPKRQGLVANKSLRWQIKGWGKKSSAFHWFLSYILKTCSSTNKVTCCPTQLNISNCAPNKRALLTCQF